MTEVYFLKIQETDKTFAIIVKELVISLEIVKTKEFKGNKDNKDQDIKTIDHMDLNAIIVNNLVIWLEIVQKSKLKNNAMDARKQVIWPRIVHKVTEKGNQNVTNVTKQDILPNNVKVKFYINIQIENRKKKLQLGSVGYDFCHISNLNILLNFKSLFNLNVIYIYNYCFGQY